MNIFAPVYALFLIGVIVASLFVIFHIIRYSLKPATILPTVVIFGFVMMLFIVINIVAFITIPFEDLLVFSGISI